MIALLYKDSLRIVTEQIGRATPKHGFKIERQLGSGCGTVGRAVASDTRDPRLESSHRQILNLRKSVLRPRLNVIIVHVKSGILDVFIPGSGRSYFFVQL